MLRRRPSLIAFDLDGTLVDSAPDIAYAVDQMLLRLGLEPQGEEQVRGWIGRGMAMLVRRALTGCLWPSGDPPHMAEAQAIFMAVYQDHLAERTTLYEGALPCLEALRLESLPLALVTNKPARFTHALVKAMGLEGFFEVIASGDDFVHQKPHPEPLLKTAERIGVDPLGSLMVGDSQADAEAARRAGFMLACVPYGYHGGEGVLRFEPDLLLETLEDLPGQVLSLSIGSP